MTKQKYIVAVAACGADAMAGPVISVGLVYDVTALEPTFRFSVDGTYEAVPLSAFHDLPKPYRRPALDYLRSHALSFALTAIPPVLLRDCQEASCRDGQILRNTAMAGVRALERFIHTLDGPAAAGVTRRSVSWQNLGGAELPDRFVYGTQQAVEWSWQTAAAAELAKDIRSGLMMGAASKYPNYRFDKHMGYRTKQHKAELKKYGPCHEHWSHK